MSFSSDVKQELNKSTNLTNKDIVRNELNGYLMSGNISIQKNKNIKFTTESDYNINRFSKLLSNLDISHNIEVSGKNFIITIRQKEIENIKNIIPQKEEEKKAFIRGSFMGGGSMNNPENKYHLEISISSNENLEIIKKLLLDVGIEFKTLIFDKKFFLYLKDGEEISRFLAYIGANRAVMQFEDIRIQREMRGKVNRIVNCESANLNKTINASIEQIAAIKKLQQEKKFNKLDEKLKEIAILRLENPDVSLIELGKMLKEPLGKSGVNYRLKKIMEIANK